MKLGIKMTQEVKSMSSYQTSFCDICYDSELEAVMYIWKGYAQTIDIKEAVEVSLNIAIQHNAEKMLFNTNHAPTFTKEYEDWQSNIFIPNAIESGIKWISVVSPGHVIKEKILNRMVKLDHPITIQMFPTFEEAKKWLE